MKTWEMIKELTENPEKEFISYKLGGGKDDVLKTKSIDGIIRFYNKGGGWHGKLIGVDPEREWEEEKERVDFRTAIKALNGGKVIYVIRTDGYREVFNPAGKQTDWGVAVEQSQGYAVDTETILYGKWYIQDEEELKKEVWIDRVYS